MGQKVHPLGFRVGITQKHQSIWFARFQRRHYAQAVWEDRLLRQTLLKLFPTLFNADRGPKFMGSNLRRGASKTARMAYKAPQITRIRIERRWMPYTIGIHIHTDNCQAVRTALDRLKVSPDLLQRLQLTRHWLSELKTQCPSLLKPVKSTTQRTKRATKRGFVKSKGLQSRTTRGRKRGRSNPTLRGQGPTKRRFAGRKKSRGTKFGFVRRVKQWATNLPPRPKRNSRRWLSHAAFKQRRFLQRRARKRRALRYWQSRRHYWNRSLRLVKAGASFRVRTGRKNYALASPPTNLRFVAKLYTKRSYKFKGLWVRQRRVRSNVAARWAAAGRLNNKGRRVPRRNRRPWLRWLREPFAAPRLQTKNLLPMAKRGLSAKNRPAPTPNVLRPVSAWSIDRTNATPRQKAMVTTLMGGLNTAFLLHLRQQTQAVKKRFLAGMPGWGYRRRWAVGTRRIASLKKLGRRGLQRLWHVLCLRGQHHAYQLRRRFYTHGRLSLAVMMPFWQWIRMAKAVKALLGGLPKRAVKKRVVVSLALRKARKAKKAKLAQRAAAVKKAKNLRPRIIAALRRRLPPPDGSRNWEQFIIRQRVQRMRNHLRCLRLTGHLSDLLQKHRRDHVYYYLSTMAHGRAELRTAQRTTQEYASQLFGLATPVELADQALVQDRVQQAWAKFYGSAPNARTFNDSLLVDFHRESTSAQNVLQLRSHIFLKFHPVKKAQVDSHASIIAGRIVDEIERRKPFRRIIQKAKENAMKQTNVRGVKIQVSGRLNGAEIARTEWVRAGRVPLQTLRANIDYIYQPAYTIYGVIGVKVWVFKGYANLSLTPLA